MGIEYNLKFTIPTDYDPDFLFRKLPNPIDRRSMTEIYNYAIRPDGFYVIDHLVDRTVASVALRSFVDEALRIGQAVEISEA